MILFQLLLLSGQRLETLNTLILRLFQTKEVLPWLDSLHWRMWQ